MAPVSRPRPDADVPPDAHQARLDALRARRRQRLRWLAIRGGITAAVLAVLAVGLVYWALMTLGGRDFLLAQIVARLPDGTSLQWRQAEGRASGPLTLHGVRYVQESCPDVDGEPVPFGACDTPGLLSFSAERVTIDPDIRPLLGRLLRLDVLEVDDAVLVLPAPVEDDTPFQLPTWPDVLPRIGPLPLALQADTIQVDGLRVEGADGPLIDIHRIRGGLDAREGTLTLTALHVDSDRGRFTIDGRYDSDDDYRMDLTATAVLPAPLGRTRPRFGLVARGDAGHLDVVLTGRAPEPLQATLALRGGDNPQWRLRARTEALDPALLTGTGPAGTPLALDLDAHGQGGRARLQGQLHYGDVAVQLQPSQVMLEDQVLAFDPLVVDVLDGRIGVRGRADFRDAENPRVRLALTVNGVRWHGQADEDGTPAIPVVAHAHLGLAGRLQRWALIGDADLSRDGQQARVEIDGLGDDTQMTLRTLRATMPSGTLEGSGQVHWAPALAWTLDAALAGFDPGYFLPDWSGAVDGRLATRGETRDDGGLDIQAEARDLSGRLRGRALSGHGNFTLRGAPADAPDTPAHYTGEVDLSLGQSRVQATAAITDTLDVDAQLSPLLLADFMPGAAGRVSGQVQLDGRRSAPDIRADLEAADVAFGDYRAARARIQGHLPWRGGDGQMTVDASGVQAGIALDTVRAQASGTVEALQATAAVRGDIGALDLAGSLNQRPDGWRGALARLRLAPARGAAWNLGNPAGFAQRGDNWRVDEACFASTEGGNLCVAADWPGNGLTLTGTRLPLLLAEPYLPPRDDGGSWNLHGEIAVDASLRPAGGAFAGHLDVRSARGGLRFSERARRDILGYSALALQAQFSPQAIEGTLSTVIDDTGRVSAQVQTGWNDDSPLSGQIALNVDQLVWLELFSPDIVEPSGQLTGDIALAGTRGAPQLSGQARLSDFTTELPALGIVLREGNVRLDALPDGSARIAGAINSGEGTLNVDGSLSWQGEAAPLVVNLRGENVLVSDTRDLTATASPDISVTYAANRPLQVTGTVTVPEARMDLERLGDGVSASPDVVVLDPVDPDRGAPLALQLDLTLAMGDAVTLNGFGLEGTLGGNLRVRQYPGRDMLGYGTLQVGGRYRAYGQELRISRGNLSWSNDVVSDPVLDIRAERRIEAEELTAGIDVTGRASAPQANVWTDPARDQSEALAYLALGRSLSSVTGAEGRELDAASAALQAGGGLLASQLGAGLGLDDAGVMHSRALGGSVLGVGRQLSPRLYVGFGVSLLGTGQVLTLKYLLSRGFDVEIESSTLENRGSLNWRRERD